MGAHSPTDLNDVRFFLDVVATGSFSAAARAARLPPSSVSRRVARLEADLGARLMQRTTRSVRLTDAGRQYLEHAQRAFGELSVGQLRLGELQDAPRGRVRITAPSGFGEALGGLLPRFLGLHPEVRVEVELTERYVDLVTEGFDLAVRSSRATASELIGRRLIGAPRQLFASPSYLDARGTPRTLADLAKHDCVLLGRTERATWTLTMGKTTRRVPVRGRVAVNEVRFAARCAAQGLGIALLPRTVCDLLVAAGSLRHVLPRADGGVTSLWIVYPDRRLPAAARALADFLVHELPRSLRLTKAVPLLVG
jgi:DNA-binding transcriptional LysR family regulator